MLRLGVFQSAPEWKITIKRSRKNRIKISGSSQPEPDHNFIMIEALLKIYKKYHDYENYV